jgi:hypothetical protein
MNNNQIHIQNEALGIRPLNFDEIDAVSGGGEKSKAAGYIVGEVLAAAVIVGLFLL